MNNNFFNLGKELITEISLTWGNLGYLNVYFIEKSSIEKIGREVFNDYLYYKYELCDYYIANGMEFNKRWICEWWSDERGQEFQKETFCTLAGIIIDIITDDAYSWYYNEEGDYYLPKGILITA